MRDRTTIPFRKRSVEIEAEFLRCDRCGEEWHTPEDADRQFRAASDVIRREEGLLLTGEIRALRRSLGLTQRAFERLLGTGPKTVARWEAGVVFQSRAADRLMRTLRAVPEALAFVAAEAGVAVRAAPPGEADRAAADGGGRVPVAGAAPRR